MGIDTDLKKWYCKLRLDKYVASTKKSFFNMFSGKNKGKQGKPITQRLGAWIKTEMRK